MKAAIVSILSLCLVIPMTGRAEAGGFYLNPSMGAAIPMEGDAKPSISVGLSAGYAFTSYLAAGVGYSYLHATGSQELKATHMYDVNATLFKRLVVVTPYVRVGVGAYTMTFDHLDSRTEPMLKAGAGLHIHPIPFIGLTAGITYYMLSDSVDFFEPLLTLGFSLGK